MAKKEEKWDISSWEGAAKNQLLRTVRGWKVVAKGLERGWKRVGALSISYPRSAQ